MWESNAPRTHSLYEVCDLERNQGRELVVVERDRSQLERIRCGKASFLKYLFDRVAIPGVRYARIPSQVLRVKGGDGEVVHHKHRIRSGHKLV